MTDTVSVTICTFVPRVDTGLRLDRKYLIEPSSSTVIETFCRVLLPHQGQNCLVTVVVILKIENTN